MGCILMKPSDSSPPRALEKLKDESVYTPRSAFVPMKENLPRPSAAARKSVAVKGGEGKGEKEGFGRAITRESEKDSSRGLSRRIVMALSLSRHAARDEGIEELVAEGWPRWLVKNVPSEVFEGLVPKRADSYEKLNKIGQGTYSNVYKARDRHTGKIVALKKVRFDTEGPESVRFMAREITILRKLDHPNIIKLEGIATSRMQYSIYLVFDFMQSDLTKIICRPEERLTEPQVKCYMQQLLSGLQHCHERGILHRDIKGSNLLIDEEGKLKIADFGLANFYNSSRKQNLTSRVVTLWYRAPELLLGSTDYGVGIDLWSAGCLFAEMFTGRPIMPGRTEVEQLHRIFKLCGSPSDEYWKKLKLSTSFRHPLPYKPSIMEAFKELPSSSLSLLSILLALDPSYRGSASSALRNEFFSLKPLACDLSDLPVIAKVAQEESFEIQEKKKKRSARRVSEWPDAQEEDHMKMVPRASNESKVTIFRYELGINSMGDSSELVNLSPTMLPSKSKGNDQLSTTEIHPHAANNIVNSPSASGMSVAHNALGGGRIAVSIGRHRLDKRSASASILRKSKEKNRQLGIVAE